jgi:hypothetical protein
VPGIDVADIDEDKGRLGPGRTAEASAASEIELRRLFTPGRAFFDYGGTGSADKVVLGRKGVDLAADGDLDVRRSGGPITPYSLYGGGGTLSIAASTATGSAVAGQPGAAERRRRRRHAARRDRARPHHRRGRR